MGEVELYVDFNSVQAHGRLASLITFALNRAAVVPGNMIIVGDAEGNTAKAHVLDIEPSGLVRLELEGGSFIPAPLEVRSA